MRKAFTLIELLVVIGIIAVLAAILFPVFSRAKLSAQQTTDLSNLKQIGLATLLYETDNNDDFPTLVAGLCANSKVPNPLDPNDRPGGSNGNGKFSMWQNEIFNYMKSWKLFFAPNEVMPANAAARFHNLSYGYNYGYLSKLELTPDPSGCEAQEWFSGRSSTSAESPGSLVAFADGGGAAAFKDDPALAGSMLNPPDAQNSSDKFLGETERGWGFSCRNRFYDTNFSMTDGFSPRFPSGGNVAFADGHTKLMGTDALAVGTNFDVMRGCELTKVIDRTKYLWDIRGSTAPIE